MACSDRMASHATLPITKPDGSDAWRYHGEDICCIGGEVSDADLAVVLACGAADAFFYLDPAMTRPGGAISCYGEESKHHC